MGKPLLQRFCNAERLGGLLDLLAADCMDIVLYVNLSFADLLFPGIGGAEVAGVRVWDLGLPNLNLVHTPLPGSGGADGDGFRI